VGTRSRDNNKKKAKNLFGKLQRRGDHKGRGVQEHAEMTRREGATRGRPPYLDKSL